MTRSIQHLFFSDDLSKIEVRFADGSSTRYVEDFTVSPPPPPPSPSTIIKGGYFDNIPDAQAKPVADQFGMGWVRLWHTVYWGELLGPSHPTFERCRRLQAQGLKTLVVFTPPEKTGAPPADPATAANYFKAAAFSAGGSVSAWEIFNEPNLANYNTSYASQSSLWIKNALAPAYSVLAPAGQFVVSGGWSEGADGIPWMLRNGMLLYCDAVGFHPYGSSVDQHLTRVRTVRDLIGNKPLWLTEWNLHMDASLASNWANALVSAANQIAPYVQAVFHFRMTYNTSRAGVAAPFTQSGVLRQPWYDSAVAAMKAL